MASLGLNAGMSKDVIQRVGNWRTPAMVDRYAKFADSTLRDAAAKLAEITTGKELAQNGTKADSSKKRPEGRSAQVV